MTEHVLAAIDAAIDDWEVSGDAMRITHREVPPEARSTTNGRLRLGDMTYLVSFQQYVDVVAAAMGRLGAVLGEIDLTPLTEVLGHAENEPASKSTPACPIRHPVYSDNRPRHVTPYGPPPRRTRR